MAVEIVKMTGEELKRVWDRSGLKQTDMPERLGISPASFYNYVKQKEIPEAVEMRIDKDPELSRCKNMALSKPDEPIKAPELVKFITDTFELLKDQSALTSRAVDAATRAIDTLSADNNILRKLVEAGLDAGAIKWNKAS